MLQSKRLVAANVFGVLDKHVLILHRRRVAILCQRGYGHQ